MRLHAMLLSLVVAGISEPVMGQYFEAETGQNSAMYQGYAVKPSPQTQPYSSPSQHDQQGQVKPYSETHTPPTPMDHKPYGFATPLYLPDGKVMLCQPGFNGAVHCY